MVFDGAKVFGGTRGRITIKSMHGTAQCEGRDPAIGSFTTYLLQMGKLRPSKVRASQITWRHVTKWWKLTPQTSSLPPVPHAPCLPLASYSVANHIFNRALSIL